MGPNEPYWRTNSSYSPPSSRRDLRFQPEGLSFGSYDNVQLHGSSTSSNSRGSRSWLRDNQISNNQCSNSDGVGPYFSSPSEFSVSLQWTPPAIQEIKVDEYGTSSTKVLGPISLSPSMEGTSAIQNSTSSISSRSDSSDYEPIHKSNLSTQRNFPSRRYFMSKPIHPLSFPSLTPSREAAESSFTSYSDLANATPNRDNTCRLSSGSGSIDFESMETDFFSRLGNSSESAKCALCDRLLSQRSPWSSHRIVKSGDMPIAGVLSCRHVFHAECLEQITPKTCKNDPPCPLCMRSEEEHYQETSVSTKLRSRFPKMKTFSEEGSSRPWGCAQAGDCVQGALHAPPCNTILSLNRNQVRKNLSLKGKEFPGKLRKVGINQEVAGLSKTTIGGQRLSN